MAGFKVGVLRWQPCNQVDQSLARESTRQSCAVGASADGDFVQGSALV